MKTPFRLDDHPRRAHPFSAPPADYFDRLPTRVMARVQPGATRATGLGWLLALPAPLRTALASTLVLGSFAASFFLARPAAVSTPATADATLAAIPQTEVVQYLLTSDQHVSLNDLTVLAATDQDLTASFLPASSPELEEALESQPIEDTYL
ncbi:hypothetical protein LJY25_08820 [Hymenobacter sp. BT175]|uniref:hypothetical protein n=1 Tax=Hymenobacter translucens TaxID=2886507 RepID=UPI001D0F3F68|nr:hypothetical protein [Hymenobacter translucens]MCC2546543.1 hypothetical protein [Hymenobacter translucens]